MRLRHLVTICLVLSALLVVPAVLADDRFVSSESEGVKMSPESAENYWTCERMKNALPYPMASPKRMPELIPAGTIPPQSDGEPGLSPGGLSTVGLSESLLTREDSDSSDLLPLPPTLANGYDYPFPFTRFEVLKKLYKTYPYRTIGKVFFTTAGGNSCCSGSSVGGRAVLTAGHCVSDGAGHFHENWVFVPAYRNTKESCFERPIKGSKPYGAWSAEDLWTFTVWHLDGEWCRDVGFGIVKKKGGKTLSKRVGWLGFAWNWDAEKIHWNIFGYPVEGDVYDGARMIECQASFATWTAEWWEQSGNCESPLPHCVGCDQTGGASGGPWIKDFVPGQAGANNYANSVVSTYYLPNRVPGGLCGPYFDTAVWEFWDFIIGQ